MQVVIVFLFSWVHTHPKHVKAQTRITRANFIIWFLGHLFCYSFWGGSLFFPMSFFVSWPKFRTLLFVCKKISLLEFIIFNFYFFSVWVLFFFFLPKQKTTWSSNSYYSWLRNCRLWACESERSVRVSRHHSQVP